MQKLGAVEEVGKVSESLSVLTRKQKSFGETWRDIKSLETNFHSTTYLINHSVI